MRWSSATAAVLLVCGGILESPPANAGPGTPPPKSAAEADAAKANKALAARSFGAAAEGYEAAYRKDSNPKWLWSAAGARKQNGDLAQAANAYARFLEIAPETDKRRATAKKELASLGSKLAQLAIAADGASLVTLDGQEIELPLAATIYVPPGSHLVEARFGEENAKRSVTARAGEAATVVLTRPEPPPAAEVAAPRVEDEPAPKQRTRPLPPLVVWIGAGATAVAGGLTILSGLDVLSQKETFEADRSRANLEAGKDKQLRTNVLIAVTGTAAVLTGVAALWLVDWKRGRESTIKVGAGPSSVTVRGTF